MKIKTTTTILLLISLFVIGCKDANTENVLESETVLNNETQPVAQTDTLKQIKPTLFANLGESCSTPDGMAINKKGQLFLAVTNLASFEQYGSKILTFDKDNNPSTWFDQLPLHPITKKVHPMGIEFGSDGNLYIADNQNFAGQTNQSRILRVVVKDGKPLKAEVLVEGLGFSNGIRINNNKIYVSDFMFENKMESGIYSFSIADVNKGKIIMNDELRAKHLVGKFNTGIDGITFDDKGNLYAGHFFNGNITQFQFDETGKVTARKIVFESNTFNCADGLFFDKERNSIFIANLSNNSIHQFNLTTNKMELIWENGDNNGADGLLDNPCETIIYKGNLVVVNFDTFQGVKNKEVDSFNTISVFKLD
jgi:sugar lactone lactonase YvrE